MAISGSQKTGLKPNALPGAAYSSFSGKAGVIKKLDVETTLAVVTNISTGTSTR